MKAMLMWLLLLGGCPIIIADPDWSDVAIARHPGHYPYVYCHMIGSILNGTDGFFYSAASNKDADVCIVSLLQIWNIAGRPDVQFKPVCDVTYDVGYAFTIFYLPRVSNYFHLHYDMLIPLYVFLMEDKRQHKPHSILYMPTVETSRLQKLNWNTDAFTDPSRYWYQMVKTFAKGQDLLPLDKKHVLDKKKITCFKELYVGTPKAKFDDPVLMTGFVKHMKQLLGVDQDAWSKEPVPRVGLISRSNRRRITNEQALVDYLAPEIKLEIIKYDGMSFKDQVELMQKYTVVAGINGAGLMNGIYLPPHGTVIQLVPYKANVNHKDYGKLLAARGPYLVWHNEHEHLHIPMPGDTHNNRPDTYVHEAEFKAVIKEALRMSESHKFQNKDEL